MNLAADYIALLLTCRLCACNISRLRLLASAAIGALYAVLAVALRSNLLQNTAFKALTGFLVAAAAFARAAPLIKATLLFFAVSFCMAGSVYAVSLALGAQPSALTPVSLRVLALSFAAGYPLIVLLSRLMRKPPALTASVRVCLGERSVEFRALRDSGNLLYDAVTGCPVMVAERESVMPLFEGKTRLLLGTYEDPAELLLSLGADTEVRFRLVSYKTVEGSGMLPAFMPDKVYTDGAACEKTLVALSRGSIGGRDTSAVIN